MIKLFTYCRMFKKLGVRKAWVVCGDNGVDEITLSGKTFVIELKK